MITCMKSKIEVLNGVVEGENEVDGEFVKTVYESVAENRPKPVQEFLRNNR